MRDPIYLLIACLVPHVNLRRTCSSNQNEATNNDQPFALDTKTSIIFDPASGSGMRKGVVVHVCVTCKLGRLAPVDKVCRCGMMFDKPSQHIFLASLSRRYRGR